MIFLLPFPVYICKLFGSVVTNSHVFNEKKVNINREGCLFENVAIFMCLNFLFQWNFYKVIAHKRVLKWWCFINEYYKKALLILSWNHSWLWLNIKAFLLIIIQYLIKNSQHDAIEISWFEFWFFIKFFIAYWKVKVHALTR